MSRLLALLALLSFSGCAIAPVAPQVAYPSWLEMKEGYAEGCIADGGCVPVSQRELEALVQLVHRKTMEECTNKRTSW